MTAWRKVQGDVNDTITVILNGVEDLTTVTSVVAHVWHGQATPIVLPAAVTDPVTRTVVVQLGGAAGWLSAATITVWFIEVQATFASGTVLTWPSGRPDTISVRADV